MNNYTIEQIEEKLSKRIDYQEIARVLEGDLNHIANITWEEGNSIVEFRVFFDYAEFETAIQVQHEGEGQPQRITPVLLSLLNGDFTEPKGPELFNATFRVEAFGFDQDKERLRVIFEVFSSLNQGAILSEMFGATLTTSFTDFPIMTPAEPYKGVNRFSVFFVWNMNFLFTGQLGNDVKVLIDGEKLDFTSFAIRRERIQETDQPNNKDETVSIASSQMLVFSGGIVYDNKNTSKKLLRNIKNLGAGLTENFTLEIEYPSVGDTDTYNVLLMDGDISIPSGGVMSLTFTMAITEIGTTTTTTPAPTTTTTTTEAPTTTTSTTTTPAPTAESESATFTPEFTGSASGELTQTDSTEDAAGTVQFTGTASGISDENTPEPV